MLSYICICRTVDWW